VGGFAGFAGFAKKVGGFGSFHLLSMYQLELLLIKCAIEK